MALVSPPGSHGVTDRILWAPIQNPPSVTSVASVRCFPHCACFSPRSHGVRVTDDGLRSSARGPNVSHPTAFKHQRPVMESVPFTEEPLWQPHTDQISRSNLARFTVIGSREDRIFGPSEVMVSLRLVRSRSGGFLDRDRRISCCPIPHSGGKNSPA